MEPSKDFEKQIVAEAVALLKKKFAKRPTVVLALGVVESVVDSEIDAGLFDELVAFATSRVVANLNQPKE